MNTTPTRMAYDRYNKATTAKYSRSTRQKRDSRREENSRKEGSPFHPHPYHQAVRGLDAARCCVVHTDCRAQRWCDTFS